MRSATPTDSLTTFTHNPDNPYFGWIGPVLIWCWTKAPKRGLKYYSFALFVLLLCVLPKGLEKRDANGNLTRHLPSAVALPVAILAAGGAGYIASKFEEYAATLAGESEALEVHAIELDTAQTTLRRTQQKADVAFAQHQIYRALPAEVAKEVRPKQPTNVEPIEDSQLLADAISGNLKLKVKGKENADEGADGDRTEARTDNSTIPKSTNTGNYHTASGGLRIAAEPRSRFDYFPGEVRGKKVSCIDLSSVDSYCGIPVVDLAEDIARDDKTTFLIGITGSGKSQLTARAIGLAHQYKPLTDGAVITHKSPNRRDGEVFNYAGLEDSDEYWIVAGEGSSAYEHQQEIERLESFVNRAYANLKHGRSAESPSLLVIDEYGNGLVAINIISDGLVAEGKKPVSTQLEAYYGNCVRKINTQGNSNKVRGLITSHDSITEELNMSVGERRNARFVYLGRGSQLDSIELTLDPTRKMMSKYEAAELNTLVSQYKTAHRQMGSPENVVLALTNVASVGWRLVIVSQNLEVPRINATAVNPPKNSIGYVGDGDIQLMPKLKRPAPEPEPTDLADEEETTDEEYRNDMQPASLDEQITTLNKLWDIPTNSENGSTGLEIEQLEPETITPEPAVLDTVIDSGEMSDRHANAKQSDFIGGSAPSWMTYGDFSYLMEKLQQHLATPDGMTLALLRNKLWLYRDSEGIDGLTRLTEALRWLEKDKIVEMESEKPYRVYYLGIDHLKD